MNRKIVSTVLIFSIVLSLFTGVTFSASKVYGEEQDGSSSTNYNTFKISDDGGWFTLKNKDTKGKWQYLKNCSFLSGTEDGLSFEKGMVNLIFVANLYKDSSMKWLNDEHTKVEFVIDGKKLVFTDGSYSYTSNGVKKSISSIPYASKKPTVDELGDPTNKTYLEIWEYLNGFYSGRQTLFKQLCIEKGVHDKFLDVKYQPFSTKFFNVPASLLLQEGFYVMTTNEGLCDYELLMSIPKEKINRELGDFIFTKDYKISNKNLMNLKFTEQFNSLPIDIRKIAVNNYKKSTATDLPFGTFFSGKSWTTKEKVDSLKDGTIVYYGKDRTIHGIDISFILDDSYNYQIFDIIEKLGLPKDFAQHLYDTVLSYNDWYELNQKMTYAFTSSNGNTYKYYLGRSDVAGQCSYDSSVINILVPDHPAMAGEHFMGGYYYLISSSCKGLGKETAIIGSNYGYRDDFFLGYELPNNVRVNLGMKKIKGNVKTWSQWRKAYNNNPSKLIKTTFDYRE